MLGRQLQPHRLAADGETVRVLAPANVSIAPDENVWLHLPPEHCRALAR